MGAVSYQTFGPSLRAKALRGLASKVRPFNLVATIGIYAAYDFWGPSRQEPIGFDQHKGRGSSPSRSDTNKRAASARQAPT